MVFITGDDLSNLKQTKSIVKVCGITYYFDDFLDAIETCFKLYFALNSKYPEEAELPWTFAEKFVFKLTKSPMAPQVETLAKQCEGYMKQRQQK
jgi:hypothetical protein